MNRVLRQLARHPWLVLLAVVAVTALAGRAIYNPFTGEVHLSIDPSLNRLLPANDPAKLFYDEVRRTFGNDETLIVAVHAPDIFTSRKLSSMR